MMPFVIGRPASIRALEHALDKDKRVFLAAQHDAQVDDPQPQDIYTMGCVANVVQSLKLPDGNIKVLVEGVERARVVRDRAARAGRLEGPLDRAELQRGLEDVPAGADDAYTVTLGHLEPPRAR